MLNADPLMVIAELWSDQPPPRSIIKLFCLEAQVSFWKWTFEISSQCNTFAFEKAEIAFDI